MQSSTEGMKTSGMAHLTEYVNMQNVATWKLLVWVANTVIFISLLEEIKDDFALFYVNFGEKLQYLVGQWSFTTTQDVKVRYSVEGVHLEVMVDFMQKHDCSIA